MGLSPPTPTAQAHSFLEQFLRFIGEGGREGKEGRKEGKLVLSSSLICKKHELNVLVQSIDYQIFFHNYFMSTTLLGIVVDTKVILICSA